MVGHSGIECRKTVEKVLIACLRAAGQQQLLLLLLDAQLHLQQVLVPARPAGQLAQVGQTEQLQTAGLQRLHAVAGRLATEQVVEVEKLVTLPVELLDVLAAIRQHQLGPQQPLLHPDQQIRAVASVPEAAFWAEGQRAGKREEARGLLFICDLRPIEGGSVSQHD